jgi:hypothetical protein
MLIACTGYSSSSITWNGHEIVVNGFGDLYTSTTSDATVIRLGADNEIRITETQVTVNGYTKETSPFKKMLIDAGKQGVTIEIDGQPFWP